MLRMLPRPVEVALVCAGATSSAFAATDAEQVAGLVVEEARAPEASAGTEPAEAPSEAPPETRVKRDSVERGFIFHPSAPRLHAFRFAVGGYYDAIDSQVMYGYNVRVPQVTLDARYGLGKGFSLGAHLNSMFVLSELMVGGSYARRFDQWSVELAASVGVYVGKLARFGFDALLVAPEYRPEVAVGYDLGNIAISFRAALLLMGPERVRVGEVWGGLDNSDVFVGHSEMLFVENATASGGAWYFGAGAMTTRSYYALWLLFPDSPALFTYPRVVAGYEF
jgi:hypothetical protein